MRRLPPPLNGPGLILLADVTSDIPRSGKTIHRISGQVAAPAAGLAIYRSDDGNGYYLFGCDSEWEVVTDTWHPTIEEAKSQAEFEYPGIAEHWYKPA